MSIFGTKRHDDKEVVLLCTLSDPFRTDILLGVLEENKIPYLRHEAGGGTRLAELYEKEPFALLDLQEYIEIVCRQIECLPPRTVVMRLCSDSAPGLCLSPLWPQKKFVVQNEADKWFLRHDAYQGKAWEE